MHTERIRLRLARRLRGGGNRRGRRYDRVVGPMMRNVGGMLGEFVAYSEVGKFNGILSTM